MKKSAIAISFLVLMILFASPVSASADTKAGIKPGSFFYFFDTTFEKIGLFFTFSPEKKVQKNLEYAGERLAEAEAVAEEKNTDAVKTAVAGYESSIALAAEESSQIKDKGKTEELLNSIADNTSKHQEILAEVLNKVPDEAKDAIIKAIEVSRKGQEEALKQIAELKGEVEKLKKEVAELKTQNEEQEKTIGEVSKQKPETKPKPTPTSTSIKPTTSQTSETTATPKPATTSSQTQTQTNEQQNTQPVVQPPSNTTNTTPTPTTQTQISTTIQISSVSVVSSLSSAKIEWQTNIPTNSKVFLSGGSLSSKVYNSESGLSTRHIVNTTGLTSGTTYSYEIESIIGEQVAKKQDSFTTKPDEYTISIQPDKTSVPASGWNEVSLKVSALKNGELQNHQRISMTTPDPSQNQTRDWDATYSTFGYRPKTVGTHTLVFSWNGVSKSVDISAFSYTPINPKVISANANVSPEVECGYTNATIGKITLADEDVYDPIAVQDFYIESNNGTIKGTWKDADNELILTLLKVTKTGNFSVTINDSNFKARGMVSGLYKTIEGLPITINYEIKDKVSYSIQSIVPYRGGNQIIYSGNVDIWYLIHNKTNNPISVGKIKAKVTTQDSTPRVFDVETTNTQNVVIASCSSNQANKISFNNSYETITGPFKIETVSIETDSPVPITGEKEIIKYLP